MTKYNNRKVNVDGITFDSVREAHRYKQLAMLARAGQIQDLRVQVKYLLVPKQQGERAVDYYADFVYMENGKQIVEDVKGYKGNPVWIIKRKLMLFVHGIKIVEV